ncbi:hypothetical protein KUC3_21190 [Alteromonas sp. KC3]|nr:hypothetical protein KUC3_21190 [Alteromonas sp. KC3]BCO23222.1 hypothetical protein KUC14_20910 [Alteromonas sp. KC14]
MGAGSAKSKFPIWGRSAIDGVCAQPVKIATNKKKKMRLTFLHMVKNVFYRKRKTA